MWCPCRESYLLPHLLGAKFRSDCTSERGLYESPICLKILNLLIGASYVRAEKKSGVATALPRAISSRSIVRVVAWPNRKVFYIISTLWAARLSRFEPKQAGRRRWEEDGTQGAAARSGAALGPPGLETPTNIQPLRTKYIRITCCFCRKKTFQIM